MALTAIDTKSALADLAKDLDQTNVPEIVFRMAASAGASLEQFAATSDIVPTREARQRIFAGASQETRLRMFELQSIWTLLLKRLLYMRDDEWLDKPLAAIFYYVKNLIDYATAIQHAYQRQSLAPTENVHDLLHIVVVLYDLVDIANYLVGDKEIASYLKSGDHLRSGPLRDVMLEVGGEVGRFVGRRMRFVALGARGLATVFGRLTVRDYAMFAVMILETYDRQPAHVDRISLTLQLLTRGSEAFDDNALSSLFIGQPTIEWYAYGMLPTVTVRPGVVLRAYVAAKNTVLSVMALAANALITTMPGADESVRRTLTTVFSGALALPLYNFLIMTAFVRLLKLLFDQGRMHEERERVERQLVESKRQQKEMMDDIGELRTLLRQARR